MKKEYDIHRNYDLMEFIFDDEIKKSVYELVNIYRSEFITNIDKKWFLRDLALEMQGIPLFEELKYFYNNDVCISCATSISIMKNSRFNLRTYAFYYENAVHRIEESWEYIHILLGEILNLELVVGSDIRDTNIKSRCGDLEFVKNENGYKPVFYPYSGEELRIAQSSAEKDNVLLNVSVNKKKSIFHKVLKKRNTINKRIQKIEELFYSDEACEIHRIRNELVHRRSLGSKFTVGPCMIGPGQSICIDPKGWFSFIGKENLLEKNLSIIREVIQIIQDIIFNHDLPNKKENQNKEFYCRSAYCDSCNSELIIPDEMAKFFIERHLKVPCPGCGKNGIKVTEKIPVNDQFFYDSFRQYNEAISKYADTMFEKEE